MIYHYHQHVTRTYLYVTKFDESVDDDRQEKTNHPGIVIKEINNPDHSGKDGDEQPVKSRIVAQLLLQMVDDTSVPCQRHLGWSFILRLHLCNIVHYTMVR